MAHNKPIGTTIHNSVHIQLRSNSYFERAIGAFRGAVCSHIVQAEHLLQMKLQTEQSLIFTTYSNNSSCVVTVANPERTVQQTERAAREMKEKMFCKGGGRGRTIGSEI